MQRDGIGEDWLSEIMSGSVGRWLFVKCSYGLQLGRTYSPQRQRHWGSPSLGLNGGLTVSKDSVFIISIYRESHVNRGLRLRLHCARWISEPIGDE